MPSYNRLKTRLFISENLTQTIEVGGLYFHCPTARSTHDTNAVLNDGEPDTIAWLDGLDTDETLWDIGANVGPFSVYAAVRAGLRVVALEPSASSYATLVKNIEINGLSGRLDAYCVALADETKIDFLHMANTEAGHSMHAFGTSQTADGEIAPVFLQATLGFSGDEFSQTFNVPAPRYVKLDVDGNELKVLKGMRGLLSRDVQSILVEAADHPEKEAISSFLMDIGFSLAPNALSTNARNLIFEKNNIK